MLVLRVLAFAQRTVTGQVVNEQGNAVPFAFVTVNGTKTGVAADESGRFSIQAAFNIPLSAGAPATQPVPVRLYYPNTEVGANSKTPSQAADVVFTSRLFWDVDYNSFHK